MTYPTSLSAREQWLDGTGGRIFSRHWPALGKTIASLVICHGFNAHSGHYTRAAEVFAQRGIAVTAPDLRGRGRSEGERFYVEAMEDYADDLSLAIAFAKAEAPGLPLYVLGHGAGGVTAIFYAMADQKQIEGLIVESAAYRTFAADLALQVPKGASHLFPHAHGLRLKREDFSRDPAWVAALAADPLIHDEVQPVQTMIALARADEKLEEAFARLTLPILVLHGTADKATRPEGSQALVDVSHSKDKTLKLYDGHYHDLLNDLDRDRVMNDIGNWIEPRASNATALR